MGKKVFDCPVTYDTSTNKLSALCTDNTNGRSKSVKGDDFLWHHDGTDIQSFTLRFMSGTDKTGTPCAAPPFDGVVSNPGMFWGSGINRTCSREVYYVADAVLPTGETVSTDPIIIVGSFRFGPTEFVDVFTSAAGILSLTLVAVIALFIGRASRSGSGG